MTRDNRGTASSLGNPVSGSNTSAPAEFNEFTIEGGGPTDPPSDVTPKAITRLKVQ